MEIQHKKKDKKIKKYKLITAEFSMYLFQYIVDTYSLFQKMEGSIFVHKKSGHAEDSLEKKS